MSAATRLRRHDESMRIIVLEKSGYVSFANCGLPYYLGGVIEERDSLLLQTPESLAQRFELDVRVNSEVLSIDRAAQAIDVKIAAGTETLNYDELILSPGATPFVPPLPGVEQALTPLWRALMSCPPVHLLLWWAVVLWVLRLQKTSLIEASTFLWWKLHPR